MVNRGTRKKTTGQKTRKILRREKENRKEDYNIFT
jgi:hypothetical protein